MSDLFTIIGAEGFVGSALSDALEREGSRVFRWTRQLRPPAGDSLGHVMFAAGITADFRTRRPAAAQAHVGLLAEVLADASFSSLTYFSSARLYRLASHSREDAQFMVCPADPEQLYDLTKLAGESLCLGDSRAAVRVVRLANVAGVDAHSSNFLPSLIRDGLTHRHIELRSDASSCKDYVLLNDVVSLLPRIAVSGRRRLYNIASGETTQAGAITRRIAEITGCSVTMQPQAPVIRQPSIDIARIIEEFGFSPKPLMPELENIIHATRIALQG